jgi:hypothetical protein
MSTEIETWQILQGTLTPLHSPENQGADVIGLSASDERVPWLPLETFASADRCGDYWSAWRRD